MLKKLFIPGIHNNYSPTLLGARAFLVYAAILVLVNTLFGALNLTKVSANISYDEILSGHNAARAQNGLKPLKTSTLLNQSAAAKARDMLASDCWSHYCPEGKDWRDYFFAVGYNYQQAGENLAEGFSNPNTLISSWMNSPTHRANILNSDFTDIGIGIVTGNFQGKENNSLIVIHFGRSLSNQILGDISSNKSETVSDNGAYVTIVSPIDGEVIPSSRFNVNGTVNPAGADVTVLVNNIPEGRINAAGNNYAIRIGDFNVDGQYTLKTIVYDSQGTQIASSAEIRVYIDKNAPIIFEDSIRFEKVGEALTVSFKTSDDTTRVNANVSNANISFDEKTSEWKVGLSISQVNSDYIVFSAFDRIGQASEFFIRSDEVLNFEPKDLAASTIQNYNDQISVDFVKTIREAGIVNYVPLVFMIYLFAIVAVDFIVLLKTNMLITVTRKAHLNLATVALLAMILIVGGISSGNILFGLSS